jgi:adenosine deaminase
MAKNTNTQLPSDTAEGLRELVFKDSYNSLPEYLQGFAYICPVLRDLENIERASYELAIDNQNEGVLYIEVRFAPQLLMDLDNGLSMEAVLTACNKGLDRAKKEFNISRAEGIPEFNYGIIPCAMRMFEASFSPAYKKFYDVYQFSKPDNIFSQAALEVARGAVKLRDEKGLPIVGIDLAGQEEGYPAVNFVKAYEHAHKHFMHKTVHAGEAYGAESIFQAITELNAERIGHGYYLFDKDRVVLSSIENKQKYIDDLSSYMADRRTVLEVCLTSNLQTNPKLKSIKDHPVKMMIDNRMALTICTDNRLVSNTTVTREYELLLNNFDVPMKRLKDIVAYGFKKSFFFGNYVDKRSYAKDVMQYFDKVAAKHNL